MYDFQGQAPFLYELSNPVFLHYQTMKAADPEAFDALLEMGNVDDPPPRQGSAKILQWELNVVSLSLEAQLLPGHLDRRKHHGGGGGP